MIKQSKGVKNKCDKLFSEIIRSRGYCQNCLKSNGVQLQCAHIISRRYSATRTDERNCVCLCASCHFYYTQWPREFSKFITKEIGSELYEELKLKAETVTKVDWQAEYTRLQELSKSLLTS